MVYERIHNWGGTILYIRSTIHPRDTGIAIGPSYQPRHPKKRPRLRGRRATAQQGVPRAWTSVATGKGQR